MTAADAIAYFKQHYPGKEIIKLPAENPEEIICEIDPGDDHPNYSVAMAAIRLSKPHLHHRAVETYEVIQGRLKLIVDDEVIGLNPGQKYTVNPPLVHCAKGDFSLVRVTSIPGWTNDDHELIDKTCI